MPQMSPLWWELLFSMFFITYLMVNTLIYFLSMNNIPMKSNIKLNKKHIKWMW